MTAHTRVQYSKILSELERNPNGLTRLEIARLLGIQKTAHIPKLLNVLIDDNQIFFKRGIDQRRRNVFVYFLNELRSK